MESIRKYNLSWPVKALVYFIIICFSSTSIIPPRTAQAQAVLNLPLPGSFLPPSAGFSPVIIKGINIDPANPLQFDFIIDRGDAHLEGDEFRDESSKLIKYFLAALTVPEKEMWVNLSPYEENRIIPQGFDQTTMGRDLLAQDYMLKQLSASLMHPDKELGKEFWQRVRAKAKDQFGSSEIPMNTFNKIWIVPQKAFVYEHAHGAFVVESHLKVMLEEDYLALEANQNRDDHGLGNTKKDNLDIITGTAAEVVREVLIPEIEHEVNHGETFANLRQIYNAVILASWYKQALHESLLGQVYVDQHKTAGIDIDDVSINQKIYDQYVEAYKKGVYEFIREEYDPATQQIIPRKYFSGGAAFDQASLALDVEGEGNFGSDQAALSQSYNPDTQLRVLQALATMVSPTSVTVMLDAGDAAMLSNQQIAQDIIGKMSVSDYREHLFVQGNVEPADAANQVRAALKALARGEINSAYPLLGDQAKREVLESIGMSLKSQKVTNGLRFSVSYFIKDTDGDAAMTASNFPEGLSILETSVYLMLFQMTARDPEVEVNLVDLLKGEIDLTGQTDDPSQQPQTYHRIFEKFGMIPVDEERLIWKGFTGEVSLDAATLSLDLDKRIAASRILLEKTSGIHTSVKTFNRAVIDTIMAFDDFESKLYFLKNIERLTVDDQGGLYSFVLDPSGSIAFKPSPITVRGKNTPLTFGPGRVSAFEYQKASAKLSDLIDGQFSDISEFEEALYRAILTLEDENLIGFYLRSAERIRFRIGEDRLIYLNFTKDGVLSLRPINSDRAMTVQLTSEEKERLVKEISTDVASVARRIAQAVGEEVDDILITEYDFTRTFYSKLKKDRKVSPFRNIDIYFKNQDRSNGHKVDLRVKRGINELFIFISWARTSTEDELRKIKQALGISDAASIADDVRFLSTEMLPSINAAREIEKTFGLVSGSIYIEVVDGANDFIIRYFSEIKNITIQVPLAVTYKELKIFVDKKRNEIQDFFNSDAAMFSHDAIRLQLTKLINGVTVVFGEKNDLDLLNRVVHALIAEVNKRPKAKTDISRLHFLTTDPFDTFSPAVDIVKITRFEDGQSVPTGKLSVIIDLKEFQRLDNIRIQEKLDALLSAEFPIEGNAATSLEDLVDDSVKQLKLSGGVRSDEAMVARIVDNDELDQKEITRAIERSMRRNDVEYEKRLRDSLLGHALLADLRQLTQGNPRVVIDLRNLVPLNVSGIERSRRIVSYSRYLKAFGMKPVEDDSTKMTWHGFRDGVDYDAAMNSVMSDEGVVISGDSRDTKDTSRDEVGGIDFNPAINSMTIERQGDGLQLPELDVPIDMNTFKGFTPVIINVQPITNLPLLLGFADIPAEDQEVPSTEVQYNAREIEPIAQL